MAVIKKVKSNIKFRVTAGKATPAPPVGSMLGAHGVNMMEFINAFNDQTRDMGDVLVTVKVAIFEDRSFTFAVKGESMARQIRRAAPLESKRARAYRIKTKSAPFPKLRSMSSPKAR